MRYLLVVAVLVLSACSTTVPVTMKWPGIPEELTKDCPDLVKQEPTEKLSDVLLTVSKNYGQYHECRAKLQAWQEWYTSQEQIYKSVK